MSDTEANDTNVQSTETEGTEPQAADQYHDGNERDIQAKQDENVTDSDAIDGDMDASKVQVLPGTGGPDDVGYTEVEPDDYNRSGH